MKGLLRTSLAALLIVTLAGSAGASLFLSDYHGYDYTWPMPWDFTSPGQMYDAVGMVTQMNPAFHVIDNAQEYTMHITSGMLTDPDTLGTFAIYKYDSGMGTFGIYRDVIGNGTTADYGMWPPNPTAPSTFIDGELVLGATFTTLTIIIDLNTGDGSLSGTMNFDSGLEIGNIPPGQLDGWTFAGLGAGMPGTPDGYIWQIDGEVYLPDPTSTQQVNWGKIKKLFQ